MNIFGRKPQQNANGFTLSPVHLSQLADGAMTTLTLLNEDIIMTLLNGEPVAFSGTCPHAAADLADGELHRGRISCPDHGWKFDISTGRTLWPEDEACRLKHFAVTIIDDVLWIKLG